MCDGTRVGVVGAGFVGASRDETVETVDTRGDDCVELVDDIDESLLGKGTGLFPLLEVLMVWPGPTWAWVSGGWDCKSCPPSVREGLAVLGFGNGSGISRNKG